MPLVDCIGPICFEALNAQTPRFFGFAEFLTGLALLVLAWTTADARYRFRVETAPLPLQRITFFVVVIVGVLSLATDVWRSEGWLVPRGNLITTGSWQALLGLIFLLTFLTWAWFAFIRPPVFGKLNTTRFAYALYRAVLNGGSGELAIVAQELGRSARTLVRHAPLHNRFAKPVTSSDRNNRIPDVERFADDLLQLLADKRLCRALVESAPATVLSIFDEIGKTERFSIDLRTFARNLVSEAIRNRDSFLYHESEGYDSGLMGYHRPLSQAMFGDIRLVEAIDSLLDPPYEERRKWDARQWGAYCRVVLIALRDHASKNIAQSSFVLGRAIEHIGDSCNDLFKLDGLVDVDLDNDSINRLRVAVNFVKNATEILEGVPIPDYVAIGYQPIGDLRRTVLDQLADAISNLIFSASAVRSPHNLCWWVQHNSLWADLGNVRSEKAVAARLIQRKVRRLIYDEIKQLRDFPNYMGAKYLGYCLNVLGLQVRTGELFADREALHRVVLYWTKKNFAWLYSYNPRIADHCLVDGLAYEPDNLRIVKSYPIEGLRRQARFEYFDVQVPPVDGDEAPQLTA